MNFFLILLIATTVTIDGANLVGSIAFHMVVKKYREFFFAPQYYRLAFMAVSFFGILSSVFSVKMIIFLQYSDSFLRDFTRGDYTVSWLNWAFRISFGVLNAMITLEILILIALALSQKSQACRKPKSFDRNILGILVSLSLFTAVPFIVTPLEIRITENGFVLPVINSKWCLLSGCSPLFAALISIIPLVLTGELNHFSDLLVVISSIWTVAFNMLFTVLSTYFADSDLAMVVWIALPITSSVFFSSVLIGRLITFPKVRRNVANIVFCRGTAKVSPIAERRRQIFYITD
ncbi:hypothetical protein L3Y34_013549 [Caenorhabditis briggsae]|uniref:Uncharacterized protein n=1 Tax=Caenorhabditis briggsae TaxID=6238 RepID=A0AAE8ZVG5_CAEBR|nr:hypothetical protein L3Y34_013549 [Caenorhabditis briggsae]